MIIVFCRRTPMRNRFNKNVIFSLDLLCVFHWGWLIITSEQRFAGKGLPEELS